jgi:uncharacterized membrane protein
MTSPPFSRSRAFFAALAVATAGFWALAFAAYHSFNVPWSEDVGIFNQICYNTVTRLSFGASIYGYANCLTQLHFSPIYVVFAPVYFFFRSPVTLMSLSIAATTLTVYCTVRIADHQLGQRTAAILFGLSVVLNPSIVNCYLHFFGRDCVFAMAFLAVALVCYLEERYALWVAALVMASLCTEYISLVVVGFGLVAASHRRPRRWILFPVVFGAGYFLLVNAVVMPVLGGGSRFGGAKVNEFAYLGGSPIEIVLNLVGHPLQTASILAERHKLSFGWRLLAPLALFPLVGLEYLVIPGSQFLLCLLPRPEYYANTGWWYHVPILPFVFTATVVGVRRLSSALKGRHTAVAAMAVVLAATLATSARPLGQVAAQQLSFVRDFRQPVWPSLAAIPRESSVSAQWPFVAAVSTRTEAFVYPNGGNTADYVVLGMGRPTIPFASRADYTAAVAQLLEGGRYGVLAAFPNGDVVLKKGYPTGRNGAALERLRSGR